MIKTGRKTRRVQKFMTKADCGEGILKNSVILIDKPPGKTSYETIDIIKKLIGEKKIGHSGTLDKFASGLLVVCTTRATKLTRFFIENDKRYIGTIKLGISTDTFDTEGEVTQRKSIENITGDDILRSAGKFVGEIFQLPPVYSALKVGGKRASDLARKGEKVNLKERKVTIFEFKITDIDLGNSKFSFSVRCSKGTYIRSLASDIGNDLNTGAHLESLRRTVSGLFSIDDAVTLERLADSIAGGCSSGSFIKKPLEALSNYSSITVNDSGRKKVLHGSFFHNDEALRIVDKDERIFTIADEDKNLIAIADIDIQEWHIKYLNVFNQNIISEK